MNGRRLDQADPLTGRSSDLATAAGERTWRQLLAETAGALGSRTEARWLVEEASGYEGTDLVLHLDDPATARCGAYLSGMVARRCAGEPLQYVLGRWPFRGLDLMVDRRVLIPRPETEEVVGWAVDAARRLLAEVRPPRHRPVAIDLGTGSGAIALSVARELGAQVWATDVSAEALDVASANLSGLGMWAATRVRIVQGSWWAALPADLRGQVDLVVSNPPYVADDEPLPDEVDRHEPAVALRAGADGLAAITEILAGMAGWLAPSGVAVIELAPHQAGRVVALARDAGARSAEVRVDGAGRARALVASW